MDVRVCGAQLYCILNQLIATVLACAGLAVWTTGYAVIATLYHGAALHHAAWIAVVPGCAAVRAANLVGHGATGRSSAGIRRIWAAGSHTGFA